MHVFEPGDEIRAPRRTYAVPNTQRKNSQAAASRGEASYQYATMFGSEVYMQYAAPSNCCQHMNSYCAEIESYYFDPWNTKPQ